MNTEIAIRDFVAEDREAVNRIVPVAWDQYSTLFERWDKLAVRLADTASLSSHGELVIAERAGQLVGVVGYVGPFRPREAIFPSDWAIVRMRSALDLYLSMGFVLHSALPDRFGVPYAVYTLTFNS